MDPSVHHQDKQDAATKDAQVAEVAVDPQIEARKLAWRRFAASRAFGQTDRTSQLTGFNTSGN